MFREEKKFISKRCKIMIISVTLLAIVMIAWGVGMRISHTAHANIDDNDVVSTTTQYVSITTTNTTDTAATTNTTATTETTDETTSTTSDVATTTQTTIGNIRDIPTRNEVQEEEVVNNAQIAIVHPVEAITINDSDPIETINETVAIDTTTESTTTHTTTVVATSTDASTTSEEVTTDETTTVEEVVTETVNEVYLGNFRITGYVATGCKTASGTWPAAGRTIAMNKSQMNALGLEYGDQIRVDGLGTYTLEDCGCKSGRIDVFCNSVKECYALPSYLDAYLVN
jgi:hypothetical protein